MNEGLGSEGSASEVGVYKGELILGGDFRKVTGSAVDAIARWDGQAWRGLESATGLSIDGTPAALLEFEGRLIVGGQFAMAGGKSASRIAAWNGSDWQSLGNGLSGTGSTVRSLANHKGQLLAGGTFSQSGSTGGIRNLARWTGTTWQQFAGGLNGGVQTLVSSGEELFVGGSFTASGSVPLKRLAKWSDTSWSEIGGGVDTTVNCILPRDRDFVIGGDFATLGGKPSAFWGRLVEDGVPRRGQAPLASSALAGKTTYIRAWPDLGFAEMNGGLSYQWQRDGMPLSNGASVSGASITGAIGVLTTTREFTLRIDNIQHAESGRYSIRYSNSCGESTSIPVEVKVKAHITDINADGQVDDADFILFLDQYDLMLCTDPLMPDACSADFNHDDLVDDADFAIFIPAYNTMLFR